VRFYFVFCFFLGGWGLSASGRGFFGVVVVLFIICVALFIVFSSCTFGVFSPSLVIRLRCFILQHPASAFFRWEFCLALSPVRCFLFLGAGLFGVLCSG